MYPFLSKPKYRDPLLNEINIKIRKKSLISELDSELESGILSIDLYNQLKDDVEKMMQLEAPEYIAKKFKIQVIKT